jgi:hypothetical protein
MVLLGRIQYSDYHLRVKSSNAAFAPFRRRPIAVEASPIVGETFPADFSADEPLPCKLSSPPLLSSSATMRCFVALRGALRAIVVLCFQLIIGSSGAP